MYIELYCRPPRPSVFAEIRTELVLNCIAYKGNLPGKNTSDYSRQGVADGRSHCVKNGVADRLFQEGWQICCEHEQQLWNQDSHVQQDRLVCIVPHKVAEPGILAYKKVHEEESCERHEGNSSIYHQQRRHWLQQQSLQEWNFSKHKLAKDNDIKEGNQVQERGYEPL